MRRTSSGLPGASALWLPIALSLIAGSLLATLDLDRLGRGGETMTLVFTEFGRRVAENRSGGTDHGAASPIWLVGAGVEAGLHGDFPSLCDLDDGDLRMTTDFLRIYASLVEGWMGIEDRCAIVGGAHEAMPLFTKPASPSRFANSRWYSVRTSPRAGPGARCSVASDEERHRWATTRRH